MKFRNSVAIMVISIAQAGLLTLGTPQAVFAASSFARPDLTRVESAETILFGNTRSSLSDESRLRALETNLFGDYKRAGTQKDRIAGIEKVIGESRSSFLLPPLAATLDTGNSLPQEAPEHLSAPALSPAEMRLQQAMQKYSNGDMSGARALFLEVTRLDSQSEDAYFNLGVIAESEGNTEEALGYYRKAYQLNPSDGELRQTVDTLSARVREDKNELLARRQAEETRAREARDLEAMKKTVSDASSDYKAGRYDQAINKLQSVASKAPSDPDVQFALGQAHKAKGDLNSAKIAFNRAYSIDPSSQVYRGAIQEVDNQLSVANNASTYDSTPAGQIAPFVPTASNPNLGNDSYSASNQGSGLTRLVSGSRVKRALAGGAMGAASGAILSATTKRSSIKSGALQGALMGGLLGYMSAR